MRERERERVRERERESEGDCAAVVYNPVSDDLQPQSVTVSV